jgi:multidrug efflux pump subunit AcrA (membrane-fusion protein)
LAFVLGIGGGLTAGAALGLHLVPAAPPVDQGQHAESPPPEPPPRAASPQAPTPTATNRLDRFRKAGPAERLAMLAGLPDNAATWYKVQRGDVDSVIERGEVDSADRGDVVCKVHARKPDSAAAATIRKLLVEDGAMVKKGQLLIELDDSELQDKLKAQKIVVETQKTEPPRIQKQAEIDIEQAQLSLEVARHQLALAERDLKGYTGNDAERKKGLELQVKEARLAVKNRDFQTTTTKAYAEAARQTARAILDAETARLKELEADIAHCKLYAPRDGLAFYYVPKTTRDWVVAEGEPVGEGQKLLYIPDLSKMQVSTRLHEAQIALVRPGQTAEVRVDAFPGRTLAGKVVQIGKAPEQGFSERVYPVVIALADKLPDFIPGRSAEVRIRTEPRRNVLRVPVRALLSDGEGHTCFVRTGAGIQELPLILGLRDRDFIEVREGLQEGDLVLRDPRTAAENSQPSRRIDATSGSN